MKKTNKILSIFLALLMIISIIPMSSVTASAATTRTADEAMAWCESQLGQTLDYDGAYGGQCVDLTMYYYKYLGVNAVGGNGCDYATNSLPSGWTRTKGGVPQKGDILVYTGGYGHVAIYESTNVSYHQNWGGQYVQKVNRPYNQGYTYNGVTVSYWGCIHPDFKSSTPINFVTGLAGNYYLQNKGSGDWLSVSENKNASTQPINTWGTWYKEFRVNLTASGSGYKMKFPEISSLLVNPYSYTPTVGTKINIYQDENDITQWWGFEKVGDAYAIRCLYNPSLVLTDNGVNQATLTTYTGASNQLWYLHPYTYSVSYNANGGSGAPSSQTKYFNESLTLSSTKPTRSGYTFLGWSTSSTATSASYSASSSFTTNANTTLYAVWKANTYTVSYNANGGSGAPASQTKTHGTTLTLSSTIPTRTGYTFLGWSTSSTATSASYSAGGSFTTNANTTLYAVWQKNAVAEPEIHVSSTSVNLTLGETENIDIYAWATDVAVAYTFRYEIKATNLVACSWGDWTNDMRCPLTITAKSKGTTTVTVSLIDYETQAVLDSVTVTVNVGVSANYVDFSIKEPSTTTIRYKDGITLHIDGYIPDGARVEWAIDSNAFDGGTYDNGMSCLLVSQNNGYATIIATLYDANGNVIATDSVELRSNAGFFQKIGGFFRSLFGTTTIYDA